MGRVAVALCVVAMVVGVPISADAAAGATKPHSFKNCTAMHKVYKHGIAKSTAAWHNEKKHGNGLKGAKPKISSAWYALNKKSDRDKDGVACEAP
jgi:hypothetical protein